MSRTIRTVSLKEVYSLPKDSYIVLVTRYYPWWLKNLKDYIDEYLPVLSPSPELLNEYKKELAILKDPGKAWRITHYESRFIREITHSSQALSEIRRLKELAKTKEVYLVCYEIGAEYCHRRLLKELIDKLNFGD